ncbi:hypothetical protein [Aeromonas veronii]|uniref:hypothetical protein n=1 Tax=Aeromonas veronii TaxID=654 RepID=UPI003D216070
MITKGEIISGACLKGIRDAHEKYKEMSGGYWASWAPEYLISVCIAERIKNEVKDGYVYLEYPVRDLMKEANALGAGRIREGVRPSGRCDIATANSERQLDGMIEVKNIRVSSLNYYHYGLDVERIIGVLSRQRKLNTLGFGIYCFNIECQVDSNDTNCGRGDFIENIFMNDVCCNYPDFDFTVVSKEIDSGYFEDNNYISYAVSILITRKL